MFAEHELRAREADVFGPHDFVRLAVLQHAVLMDAGFVREGVVADDGFVARDRRADQIGQQARGRIQQRRADVGVELEAVEARAQRHDDFFERRVARAFADAGDGAFDLPRARRERGDAIGHAEAEIVVAMRAQA